MQVIINVMFVVVIIVAIFYFYQYEKARENIDEIKEQREDDLLTIMYECDRQNGKQYNGNTTIPLNKIKELAQHQLKQVQKSN